VATSDVICRAIKTRHVLSFTYKDSIRAAEPYILGYDEAGALVLSAVQISGGSGVGFRTFLVPNLSAVMETDQRFIGRHPDYNSRDRLFARVLCQI
jgi:hypothetical protein